MKKTLLLLISTFALIACTYSKSPNNQQVINPDIDILDTNIKMGAEITAGYLPLLEGKGVDRKSVV